MKSELLIILFLIGINFISAQTENVILNGIKEKFNNENLFEADFIQVINQNSSGNNIDLKGKVFLTKNNKFIIELAKNKIVCNGNTIWNYDGRLERVVISNFEDEFSAFSINKFLFEYPEKCEITENKKDFSFFMKANDENLPFKEIKISSNRNYIINSIEITDNTETKYKIKLLNGRFTSDYNEDLFEFEVNENTEIIDLR